MKKRAKNLIFALIPLAILLITAESACRLFVPLRQKNPGGKVFVAPDPDLIWKLAPCPGPAPCTNKKGLRDGPYRPNAPVKILLLGDSVAWGEGVPELDKIFARLLEKELATRFPGTLAEVINAAVPGYSTFQEARYLALKGGDFQPDMVLLCFCLNDVTERYRTLAPYGGAARFMGIDTRTAARGLFGWLLEHSRAFYALNTLVQGLARSREDLRVARMAEENWPPALVKAWEQTLAELDGVRSTAAEMEIPFFLAVAPYRFQAARPEEARRPQDLLRAWGEERGVPVIDLLPAFAGSSGRDELFLDENHFSPAGHRLAASELCRALEPAVRDISLKKNLSLSSAGINNSRGTSVK